MKVTMIVVCVLASISFGQSDRLMEAIRMVESSGDDSTVGDGSDAIGPFQIHRGYWKDATEFDKSIGGVYEDCFDRDYARKVVRAYMKRYAPRGASDETMARIHNGGPKGHRKKSTLPYWQKVKRQLK